MTFEQWYMRHVRQIQDWANSSSWDLIAKAAWHARDNEIKHLTAHIASLREFVEDLTVLDLPEGHGQLLIRGNLLFQIVSRRRAILALLKKEASNDAH